MRTTLTLDEALLKQARKTATAKDQPLKKVINEALRLGLEKLNESQTKPYKLKARSMRLKAGLSVDNIAEALEIAEGKSFR